MKSKLHNLLDVKLIDSFPSKYPVKSYFNYVANNVPIESFISVAGMLAPRFIELNNSVFLEENIKIVHGNRDFRFGNEKKNIEKYVNLFCLSDFYLLAETESSSNGTLLLKMAHIIKAFWEIHLFESFPNRSFDVEIYENGIFDEDGICITFSEVE